MKREERRDDARDLIAPTQSVEVLAEIALQHLRTVVAIDSQSDERCASIPSTRGQVELARYLHQLLSAKGLPVEVDENNSVIATLPSNIESGSEVRPIALMVHLDTAVGTVATEELTEVPNWDGSNLQFNANRALEVSVERYPHLKPLVGQTVIHGAGEGPFGLDNKLGMAELLALVDVLMGNPALRHGEIVCVFRPDEEIGRHEAVTSLASRLAERGVKLGWTIDGSVPFELNVQNFYASRVDVELTPKPLPSPHARLLRELAFEIHGVDTHGATACEEGYLNATVIFARLYQKLRSHHGIAFVDFSRTEGKETTGSVRVVVHGESEEELDDTTAEFETALAREVSPHLWKGARIVARGVRNLTPAQWSFDDRAVQVAEHLNAFLAGAQVKPVLSEESSGFEGYTNPHWVGRVGDKIVVRYRVRDFDSAALHARERDIERICEEEGNGTSAVTPQYVDMSPALRQAPELLEWPRQAFAPLAARTAFSASELPVRGGTGVDAFTEKGIYIGNIGPGYYFLESPKELTTRELMGLHVLWLTNLVQCVLTKSPEEKGA